MHSYVSASRNYLYFSVAYHERFSGILSRNFVYLFVFYWPLLASFDQFCMTDSEKHVNGHFLILTTIWHDDCLPQALVQFPASLWPNEVKVCKGRIMYPFWAYVNMTVEIHFQLQAKTVPILLWLNFNTVVKLGTRLVATKSSGSSHQASFLRTSKKNLPPLFWAWSPTCLGCDIHRNHFTSILVLTLIHALN